MTNQDILRTALEQSAIDCNCAPGDFLSDQNIVTLSRAHPEARKYLPLPLACDLVSYGSNIVAQTSAELLEPVREYLRRYPVEHCMETPHLHALEEIVVPYGLKICFMAEYFLPDTDRLRALPCAYELRLLHPADFSGLYLPEWSNALSKRRPELDVLAIGAYDGSRLIGLAACSADCRAMYQIGVDVLPAYRRQGVASALTSRIALEILSLEKVPFYCAAWCNLKSVNNAVKCGFRPAWVEVTARDTEFVSRMNSVREDLL